MENFLENPPQTVSDEDKTSSASPKESSESASTSEWFWTSEGTSSESDFEDADEKLEYINQKQELLKRASNVFSQEDAYNAANAVHEQSIPPPCDSIWTEAKEYLYNSEGADKTAEPCTFLTVKKTCKSPRNPLIDLSVVKCTSSASFNYIEDRRSRPIAVSSLELQQGEWMAQALAKSSGTSRWKIVSDLHTFSLGLAPPDDVTFYETVSLEEATGFSTQPQIVTQATPPFSVVHVNKAFINVYGKTEVVGKPIESLFALVDDTDEVYQIGNLFGDRSCRLKVTPVVDRSRKRRKLSVSFMSHILISFGDAPTIAVIETSNETSDENTMFGTVG